MIVPNNEESMAANCRNGYVSQYFPIDRLMPPVMDLCGNVNHARLIESRLHVLYRMMINPKIGAKRSLKCVCDPLCSRRLVVKKVLRPHVGATGALIKPGFHSAPRGRPPKGIVSWNIIVATGVIVEHERRNRLWRFALLTISGPFIP